jgi:hypothetical protein
MKSITNVVWSQNTYESAFIVYSDGTSAVVPCDSRNLDFRAVLEWIAAGNIPEAPQPEPIPQPPTAAEKLESAGLTVDELKELLGL